MAKIQYGSIVTEIKGKVGGQVFQSGRYGFMLRQKPTGGNKRNNLQSQKRTAMMGASQNWRTLSDAQRTAWENVTPSWPHVDAFGNPVQLTGYSLYMMLSLRLLNLGSNINDAATLPTVLTPLTSVVATVERASSKVTIVFAPTPLNANQSLVVWASNRVSAGQGVVLSKLRQIVAFHGPTSSPAALDAEYAKVYPGKYEVGSKVHFAVQVIDSTNGTLSPMYFATAIVSA